MWVSAGRTDGSSGPAGDIKSSPVFSEIDTAN
jgi:hypothetical protein